MRPGALRAVASASQIWVTCISGRHSGEEGLPLNDASLHVFVLILETSRTFFEECPGLILRSRKCGQDLGKTTCDATRR